MSSKKTGGCREVFSCKIYVFKWNLHSKAISHLNKQTDSTYEMFLSGIKNSNSSEIGEW